MYHFVPARLQSGQLETHLAQTLRTFEGKDIYVETFRGARRIQHTGKYDHVRNSGRASFGTRLFVNGCRIRTADFVCADGVVHTIDCVLQPNFRDETGKWFGDTS